MPIMPPRTYPGDKSRLVSLTFAPAPRAKPPDQPVTTLLITDDIWGFVNSHPTYRLKYANYHDGSKESWWGRRNREVYFWLKEHFPNE